MLFTKNLNLIGTAAILLLLVSCSKSNSQSNCSSCPDSNSSGIQFQSLSEHTINAEALSKWMADGKIQYRVDIVEGIENAPRAVNKLFTGENTGKLVIKVSDEP